MELAIDTSTRYASVGLSRDGHLVAELSWHSEQNHSVELVPAVRSLMARAGADVDQIEAVLVARGPGGFTALRVGISTAKALAMARNVPLVSVGTLEMEAAPYLGLGMPVCALVPAGRELVYVARYPSNAEPGDAEPPNAVLDAEELASTVAPGTVVCGEGAVLVAATLRRTLGKDAMIADSPGPTRRASVLARLGHARLGDATPGDIDTLQPTYIRGSQFDVARSTWPVSQAKR